MGDFGDLSNFGVAVVMFLVLQIYICAGLWEQTIKKIKNFSLKRRKIANEKIKGRFLQIYGVS